MGNSPLKLLEREVVIHGFRGIPNPKGRGEQTELKVPQCLPLSNHDLRKEIVQLLYRLLAKGPLWGGGEELIFRVMRRWVQSCLAVSLLCDLWEVTPLLEPWR